MTRREVIWLRQLLAELSLRDPLQGDPTKIFEDNQSAIAVADNPAHHERTKHIAIRYHLVRNKVADRTIKLTWISTREQIADALTKPLGPEQFAEFRYRIGVRPDPNAKTE